MSAWNHPICDTCFNHQRPSQEPCRRRVPEQEICCWCRAGTDSGLYLRADPMAVACKGRHGEQSRHEVTLEHIRQAALWAKTAVKVPQAIGDTYRLYIQKVWDCGTACCIWGAANLFAGNGPTNEPVSDWWECQSEMHADIGDLLCNTQATPDEILAQLDKTL